MREISPLVKGILGVDIGSTTIKAILYHPQRKEVLWQYYQRHEAKQAEKCLEVIQYATKFFNKVSYDNLRVFVTGSGGTFLCHLMGGKYIHEVSAISHAVAAYYPNTGSAIELGGQDAKFILFHRKNGSIKPRFSTMNDKCAGGTGAILDKIAQKLCLSSETFRNLSFKGVALHPIAGKCGVFAETDIVSLQKQGIPSNELVASLFDSIVQQNLTTLTRGNTPTPDVLLLGGPNFFLRGLQECWRQRILEIWDEREIDYPSEKPPEELIIVPDNAHFFAALGAVLAGFRELVNDPQVGTFMGPKSLERYLKGGRTRSKLSQGEPALVKGPDDLLDFMLKYAPKKSTYFIPPENSHIEAYLGIDAGSTSTKAVLLDKTGRVISKAYTLSKGNPIEDVKELLTILQKQFDARNCKLTILATATTGYAKDILKEALCADLALVETVAHANAALHFYPNVDVICDVGGQDIKVLFVRDGIVRDFRLNTQCSAGNGYYLQATAASFGIPVTSYADYAFSARVMPKFSYGCAVFLQADIVDFQRQGWQPNEILAGLAAVLPKNIWLYVCKIPNLVELGKTFVLQGGTQNNLAAVKAQVDFILNRFAGTNIEPHIFVHEHCGEAGAIGCALEVRRLHLEKHFQSSFIGIEAIEKLHFSTTRNESTRCTFCSNRCMRTFIDIVCSRGDKSKLSLPQETKRESTFTKRIIVANCEKGRASHLHEYLKICENIETQKHLVPNLASYAAARAFEPVSVNSVADPLPSPRLIGLIYSRKRILRRARMLNRAQIRIGMPRVLNMYGLAPFFMGLFQSLGVSPKNIIWSDVTTDTLYREGSKRCSIDPCFPSKLCVAHVHNLLYKKHNETPLTHIFFPMIETVPTFLKNTQNSYACPTSTATPESVHAAFLKEGDLFSKHGVVFKKTFLTLSNPGLCARQFAEDWEEEIGVTENEAFRAVEAGLKVLQDFNEHMRKMGRDIITRLKQENKIGLVLLARPYHNDSGIQHGIGEEFQRYGYPVLTINSLPIDKDTLLEIFGEDFSGIVCLDEALSIEDVWKNSFSENSNRKLWAAKFVARHPNLIAIELSNFKCGHDAPISSVVREIIESTGKPFFYFKDLDENNPVGSIKIRIETILYFLARYSQELRFAHTNVMQTNNVMEQISPSPFISGQPCSQKKSETAVMS